MSSVRRVSFVFAAAAAAALAIAPPAAAGRTIRLKVPRFVVPPHTDREVCTFVRVPMKKALDLGGSVIVNVGGHGSFTTHHFLMWVYEGTDISRFPPKGQLVDSKAWPMESKSVSWAWRPGGSDFGSGLGGGAYPTGPACVVALTSHMHKRGALFTIEFLNGRTAVECADKGMMCLTATDYRDPPQ